MNFNINPQVEKLLEVLETRKKQSTNTPNTTCSIPRDHLTFTQGPTTMKRILSLTTALLVCASTAFSAVTISTYSKTFTKDGGAASVSTGGSGTWEATTASDNQALQAVLL